MVTEFATKLLPRRPPRIPHPACSLGKCPFSGRPICSRYCVNRHACESPCKWAGDKVCLWLGLEERGELTC